MFSFFFCLLLSSIKHSPHNGDWCITKVSCTVRIPLPYLYILLYKTVLFPTSGNFTQFSIGFIAYNTITEICILFSNHVQRIFGNSNNDVRKTYGRAMILSTIIPTLLYIANKNLIKISTKSKKKTGKSSSELMLHNKQVKFYPTKNLFKIYFFYFPVTFRGSKNSFFANKRIRLKIWRQRSNQSLKTFSSKNFTLEKFRPT